MRNPQAIEVIDFSPTKTFPQGTLPMQQGADICPLVSEALNWLDSVKTWS
jgi:hypothetical protein